jgi:hypothetical protein
LVAALASIGLTGGITGRSMPISQSAGAGSLHDRAHEAG